MKLARFLPLILLPALLGSCTLPEAALHQEPQQRADQTQTLALADGVRAVTERGSVYRRCGESQQPGLVLEEGRVLLTKEKDGQVVDLVAGPARARVIGTTILAQKRGPVLCIIVVEGRTRVNWGNRIGEYRMLNSGEMLMMDESQQTLPGPLLVNLSQLVSKEELLSKKFLSSEKMALIEAAVRHQGDELAAGRLLVRNPVSGSDPVQSLQAQTSQRGGTAVSAKVDIASNTILTAPVATATGTVGSVGAGIGRGTGGLVTGVVGTVAGTTTTTVTSLPLRNTVNTVTSVVSGVIGGLGR